MKLKCYQQRSLSTLTRFFREARIHGPSAAYDAIVSEPDQKARLGRYAGEYRALEEFRRLHMSAYDCQRAAAKLCLRRTPSASPAIRGLRRIIPLYFG